MYTYIYSARPLSPIPCSRALRTRTPPPLLALLQVFHGSFWTMGFTSIVFSISLGLVGADSSSIIDMLVRSFLWLLPLLVLLLVGPRNLYLYMARRFDRSLHRVVQDASFVAELSAAVPMQIGQAWWIHRKKDEDLGQSCI